MLGKKKLRLNPIPSFLFSKSISSDQCSSSSSSSVKSSSVSSSSWPWTPNYYYCHQQPRTLSFRTTTSADMLDTKYPPESAPGSEPNKPNSSFFHSSPAVAGDGGGNVGEDPQVESVIRGAKSERLFFSPGETSSSLLQDSEKGTIGGGGGGVAGDALFSIKEGGEEEAGAVAVAMDSKDPFEDFKNSMVEMVEAHGLKDWESLENLLSCYLRVNRKSNHGYIVGAFVDLLVGLPSFGPKSAPVAEVTVEAEVEVVSESNCSCSHHGHHQSHHNHYSPSSPLSFYTSFSSSSSSEDSSSTPCVSSSEVYREAGGDEIEIDGEDEISTPCAAASFVGESERRK